MGISFLQTRKPKKKNVPRSKGNVRSLGEWDSTWMDVHIGFSVQALFACHSTSTSKKFTQWCGKMGSEKRQKLHFSP